MLIYFEKKIVYDETIKNNRVKKMKNLEGLPDQIRDEVPTKNRMGYMKLELDEYSKEFVELAVKTKERVFEIGCAYGVVARQVLLRGGNITVCDMSQEHLNIFSEGLSAKLAKNVDLYAGEFPNEIEIEKKSMKAVLISRVMHFLKPEKIEKGLEKIHRWLKDGGKLYFTAITPYVVTLKDNFLPTYEQRVANKEKWPGIIRNHWELAPIHAEYLGNFLNVFDIPQLEALLPEFGFEIEKISLFDFPNDTDSGGKGHVGFVAKKISN